MGMFRTETSYGHSTIPKDYPDTIDGLKALLSDVEKTAKTNGLSENNIKSILKQVESLEVGQTTAFTINGTRILMTRVRNTPSLLAIKDILECVKKARNNKREWHAKVYDDGVWKIDMKVNGYGNMMYWVSAEYADGTYRNTLVTPYLYNNEIKVSSEFVLKQQVLNKIINIYKAMLKAKYV